MSSTSPHDLIAARGRPEPGTRVVVGYSGGLDSTVLLHVLHGLGAAFQLAAIHVDHGLQPASADWAQHCRAVCDGLGVPLHVARVDIVASGRGIEAAARDARHAAFRAVLGPGDVLATAHHLDDQAETVLLQLLRGGGVRGLAAMKPRRDLAPGSLWRPFLDTSRERLRDYALEHRLSWVEDPQNRSDRVTRSHLRAEVMPKLVTRWPGAGASLARAATLAGEAAELLDVMADEDRARLRAAGNSPGTLPIGALRRLGPARRRNVVRRWIETEGLPSAFFDTLHRLDTEVLAARVDANPVLAWPGGEMRRFRDSLFAMAPLPGPPQDAVMPWSGDGTLALPAGCGVLRGRGAGAVIVRVPTPLVRFRPSGDPHTRTLRNLFQARGVPPWVRERTPALEREGRIVWIGGIGWAEGEGGTIDWTWSA